jgi:hypothetical protein
MWSQYTSIRYTQRLVEGRAERFVGVGRRSVNASIKTWLIYWKGPWKSADDLELATLGWVD